MLHRPILYSDSKPRCGTSRARHNVQWAWHNVQWARHAKCAMNINLFPLYIVSHGLTCSTEGGFPLYIVSHGLTCSTEACNACLNGAHLFCARNAREPPTQRCHVPEQSVILRYKSCATTASRTSWLSAQYVPLCTVCPPLHVVCLFPLWFKTLDLKPPPFTPLEPTSVSVPRFRRKLNMKRNSWISC